VKAANFLPVKRRRDVSTLRTPEAPATPKWVRPEAPWTRAPAPYAPEHPPPSPPHGSGQASANTVLIVAGWIGAIFAPLIGLILGFIVNQRQKASGGIAGKAIMITSVVIMVLDILAMSLLPLP
jgi:hypothetical protein